MEYQLAYDSPSYLQTGSIGSRWSCECSEHFTVLRKWTFLVLWFLKSVYKHGEAFKFNAYRG